MNLYLKPVSIEPLSIETSYENFNENRIHINQFFFLSRYNFRERKKHQISCYFKIFAGQLIRSSPSFKTLKRNGGDAITGTSPLMLSREQRWLVLAYRLLILSRSQTTHILGHGPRPHPPFSMLPARRVITDFHHHHRRRRRGERGRVR